jgi:zinc transport system permease protein
MTMLEFGFMQRAFVACLAVCAVAPLVGTFVVQRGQSLIGDGMGHVAFAGVGLAFLWGFEPLLGAAALCVLAAFALFKLQRGGLTGDLSLALIFYGGIALGYVLLARSGMGINRVLGLLFGSPLNLGWQQAWTIVGLSALVLLIVLALYGPLLSVAFDEQAARVSGVPADGLALALTVVVGLTVVGGMYAIGLLLVAAIMVVPVAAASQVARSYRGTMAIAAAIGAGSALAGLTAAFYVDLAPGASIILVALACYLVARAARGLAGRVRSGAAT